MKWTMRYAALLAALVLALGLVEVLRPGVVAANGDVELLPLPSDKGDPDDGGGNQVLSWSSWVGSAKQTLMRLRIHRVGPNTRSKPLSNLSAKQLRAQRR
jgi:hypothetical protein